MLWICTWIGWLFWFHLPSRWFSHDFHHTITWLVWGSVGQFRCSWPQLYHLHKESFEIHVCDNKFAYPLCTRWIIVVIILILVLYRTCQCVSCCPSMLAISWLGTLTVWVKIHCISFTLLRCRRVSFCLLDHMQKKDLRIRKLLRSRITACIQLDPQN